MGEDETVKAAFHQQGWQVGNVIQVAGDLVLNPESSREDLAKSLEAVIRQLSEDPALRQSEGAAAAADELKAAVDESKASCPSKPTLLARINTATDYLKGGDKAAAAGLALAKTLAGIGAWVSTNL